MTSWQRALTWLSLVHLAGCPAPAPPAGDADGDGWSEVEGDCDDLDREVYPGATDVCDGKDNDCNDLIDDPYDEDGDGVSTCGADGVFGTPDDDCDDANPSTYPNAEEVCDDVDNDCSGFADDAPGVDEDHDGWCVAEGDCDDQRAGVNPGANEICNGLDDDCNGVVDDGYDDDGDGYSPTSCGGEDCDDGDPEIHPGAEEVCNARDDDCDGTIDEGFDDDGDGWAECSGDCDDSDPDVHPGAAEQCNGIDDNCNGQVDEEVDEDGDGVTPCGGDCDDQEPAVYPGALDGPDGLDNDCDGSVDGLYAWDLDAGVLPVSVQGAANARLGLSLAAGGDITGDGVDDAVLGAPFDDGNAQDSGSVDVVEGETGDWFGGSLVLGVASDIDGTEEDAQTGDAVAVGDLNGDGWPDVVIGSSYLWYNSSPVGEVAIFFGGPGAIGPFPATDEADVIIRGGFPGEQAGTALSAAGDVDADGIDDLLIGAPYNNVNPNVAGMVYLFFGRSSWAGDYLTTDADVTLEPTADDHLLGTALAIVPDVDGDGDDEILVGAEEAGGEDGRAYLVKGHAMLWDDQGLEDADVTFHGSGGERWGARVGGAADLDGDGRGEIWIGSLGHPPGGAVAVSLSGNGALPSSVDLPGDADVLLLGSAAEEAAVLASPGDMDGDGVADLAVGARSCAEAGVEAGALYVLLGPLGSWPDEIDLQTADARILGEAAGDWFGHAVAVGDLDDDGHGDVVVSAPYNDQNGSQAGKTYVIYGY